MDELNVNQMQTEGKPTVNVLFCLQSGRIYYSGLLLCQLSQICLPVKM